MQEHAAAPGVDVRTPLQWMSVDWGNFEVEVAVSWTR